MKKFFRISILFAICLGILIPVSTAQAVVPADEYGYVINPPSSTSWIDATGGAKLGLDSSASQPATINLPFDFPFYSKTYTQAYITPNGYLTVIPAATWPAEGRLKEYSQPNGVIAAYWSPLLYAGSDGVYTLSGGSAPDRYMVIEWHAVIDPFGNTFTFEIVLHENGDIDVQFETMNKSVGQYLCGRVGIEDEVGSDGAVYQNCSWPSMNANTQVKFVYPATQARAHAYPSFQSAFTSPNETLSFPFSLANTGNLGADTYTTVLTSTCQARVTDQSGNVLADQNTPGSIGPIAQSETAPLSALVQAPAVMNYEDTNQTSSLFTSTVDNAQTSQAGFQTGVPAPFVQAYVDSAQDAVVIEGLQPEQRIRQTIPLNGNAASNAAVLERPDHSFMVLWYLLRCSTSGCSAPIAEIDYAILDQNLAIIRQPAAVVDESQGGQADYGFAAAVAPNGDTGILWIHTAEGYQLNFTRIDSSGIVVGLTTLASGNYFSSPSVTATNDNHFMTAWGQDRYDTSTGDSFRDISIADISADGSIVLPATQLTHDSGSYKDSYVYPSLGTVAGNRVLLTYSYTDTNWQEGVYFQVINADGTTFKGQTQLANDGYTIEGREKDIVEMPGGNILIAWQGLRIITSFETYNQTHYALLDSNFNIAVADQLIYDAYAGPFESISVASDGVSNVILTWVDGSSYRLYYALIGADGTLRTPPMIIHTSSGSAPALSSSSGGVTSYSLATTAGIDLESNLPASQIVGSARRTSLGDLLGEMQFPAGKNTTVVFDLQNLGKTTASDVVLDAVVDNRLLVDAGQILPAPVAASGNSYTWQLSAIKYLGLGQIRIPVTLPTEIGVHYPVTFTLHAQGVPDQNWTVDLISGAYIYLPLVNRYSCR